MSQAVTATPGVRVVGGRQVPEVGSYAIDPSHASFQFVARHLMARTRGTFSGVSGVATIAERPEDSTLEVEIDTATVDTKDETRDAHLRSGDFFGVEDHPTISFRSTGVRPGAGEREWKVDGERPSAGSPARSPSTWSSSAAPSTPGATSASASPARCPRSTARTGA
jgi:hypothetical protein